MPERDGVTGSGNEAIFKKMSAGRWICWWFVQEKMNKD
jgi:hypothetical protein